MTWFDPRVWLAVIVAAVVGLAGGYFKGYADGARATVVAAQKAQLDAVAAYAGVSRTAGVVAACYLEAELRVEADRRLDVA